MENPPIHTQGVATCGEIQLEFVDKIGMAKLIVEHSFLSFQMLSLMFHYLPFCI